MLGQRRRYQAKETYYITKGLIYKIHNKNPPNFQACWEKMKKMIQTVKQAVGSNSPHKLAHAIQPITRGSITLTLRGVDRGRVRGILTPHPRVADLKKYHGTWTPLNTIWAGLSVFIIIIIIISVLI